MSKIEVVWSILPERSVQEYAFMAAMALAAHAGNRGYTYAASNYQRTDVARNRLADAFHRMGKNPDDVLVMLDCDHCHPYDTIERLVSHPPECGVVGALAFRRGEPFFPCFFIRNRLGHMMHPLELTGGLMKGAIVGTGAIAIRRWVFDAIAKAEYPVPFKYEYDDTMFATGEYQSEDVSFGYICEKLGIAHYCDTSLVTPHLTASAIDQTAWNAYAERYKMEHAELLEEI